MLHDADSLMLAGDFPGAESAYARVVAADSNSASGHGGLASALLYDARPARDRSRALREFEITLGLAPENALLHTRYGEALLPWRIPPELGAEGYPARLNHAVVELQRALALDPRGAEPHLALYLAYLAQGRQTEADDQLRELQTKGFFPAPALDFARDLLISIDSGGYVVTSGDIDTYPALMLQAITHLRPDVTVVNLPLLNAPWYVRYLVRERELPVSLTDSRLDTLGPTYSSRRRKTISPALRVLDDALDSRAKAKGGFYFAITAGREAMGPYKANLSLEGFVYRLAVAAADAPVNKPACVRNLTRNYRLPDFKPGVIWSANSSPVARNLANLCVDCAAAFFALADRCRRDGEFDQAAEFYNQACQLLKPARQQTAIETICEEWARMAPQDSNLLRLRSNPPGEHDGTKIEKTLRH